jgi:hypothetical protein
MRCTIRGRLVLWTVAVGIVSIWDEGSSKERASVRAMRSSMRGGGVRGRREEDEWRRREEKTKSEKGN